ncbi:protein phosphatase 2C domain-containing protein [Cryptosporangium japonicum]|uniref:PPM-type phosphatase domain-containing protein n=1 Tax=Cryptosporangium japonicum TaxID=80872 RepID=A0ABN0V0A0_9ACTN
MRSQDADPAALAANAIGDDPPPSGLRISAPTASGGAMPPCFSPSRAARRPWLLPAEPTAVPGVAADQAQVGDLILRAASVIGVGHRCDQPVRVRQDAYRVAQDLGGRHLILAVADGMSDSARAELGAQLAVASAVALVRRELDAGAAPESLLVQPLLTRVAGAMLTEAQRRGIPADDVRTTLAVAVIPTTADAGSPRRGWAAHVGDTSVWLSTGGAWKALSINEKDDFDGSALSSYLPHRPSTAKAFVFALPEQSVLLLATDGVADAFSEIEGASAWFAARWKEPPALASFLLDVDFEAKGCQDDRTAVAIWCRSASGEGRPA